MTAFQIHLVLTCSHETEPLCIRGQEKAHILSIHVPHCGEGLRSLGEGLPLERSGCGQYPPPPPSLQAHHLQTDIRSHQSVRCFSKKLLMCNLTCHQAKPPKSTTGDATARWDLIITGFPEGYTPAGMGDFRHMRAGNAFNVQEANSRGDQPATAQLCQGGQKESVAHPFIQEDAQRQKALLGLHVPRWHQPAHRLTACRRPTQGPLGIHPT